MLSLNFLSLYAIAILAVSSISSASPISYPRFGEIASRQAPTTSSESCFPLDLKNAESLASWGKVKEYIDSTFGEGVEAIVLNDPQYPGQSATTCLTSSTAAVDFKEAAQCVAQTTTSQGIVDEVKQTVTFVEDIGVEHKISAVITETATTLSAYKVGLTFEVPQTGPGGIQAATITGTVTHSVSERFEGSTSTVHQTKFEYMNTADNQCRLRVESQQCSANGASSIPVVAKGFVLAKFANPRPSLDAPNGPKHATWSISLENILSQAERTSTIKFEGPVAVLSRIVYASDCIPAPDAPEVSGGFKFDKMPL